MMNDELKIEILKSTTGCGRSDAQLALDVAGGDEEKALGLINFVRPRYLIVKVHFSGSGVRSLEGLVLVILHDGSDMPVYTTAVVVNYSEEAIYIEPGAGLVYWQQLIASNRREQSRYNIESSLETKEYIEREILPETGFTLWTSAREIKELKAGNLPEKEKDKKIAEYDRLAKESMSNLLEGHFKLNLRMDLELELITEMQFVEVSKGLGLMSTPEPGVDESIKQLESQVESKKNVTIVLQGQAVLDPSGGIFVKDLQIGDRIAVDIIERSPVADHLGKLLGLRKGHYWLHTWGFIKKFKTAESGKRQMIIEIARRIYIEALAIDEERVKCERKYHDAKHSEQVLESPSAVPGYLMIAGIALIFTFIIKILLVITNR